MKLVTQEMKQVNVYLGPEQVEHLLRFKEWLSKNRGGKIYSNPGALWEAAVMGMSFASLEEDSERSSR